MSQQRTDNDIDVPKGLVLLVCAILGVFVILATIAVVVTLSSGR